MATAFSTKAIDQKNKDFFDQLFSRLQHLHPQRRDIVKHSIAPHKVFLLLQEHCQSQRQQRLSNRKLQSTAHSANSVKQNGIICVRLRQLHKVIRLIRSEGSPHCAKKLSQENEPSLTTPFGRRRSQQRTKAIPPSRSIHPSSSDGSSNEHDRIRKLIRKHCI